MTLQQTVKRFFEPVSFVKKDYLLTLAMVVMWPFYGIITTLSFSGLVAAIQDDDKTMFGTILIGYICFALLYQLWNYLLSASAPKMLYSLFQYLDMMYFKKYITIDNNKSEMLGTGKMLSIIDKGIDQWVSLILESTWIGASSIVNILFAVYIAVNIRWYRGIVMVILLVVVLYIVALLAQKGQYWRQQRTDAVDERSRYNVKILMSKHEILVNKKIDQENQNVYDQIEIVKKLDLKKHKYEHASFNVPTLGLALISIGLFGLLGYKFFYNNDISYSEIVLYLGLLKGLESGLRDAINLYKSYIKNFVRIEKLWTTFDEMPQIIGYDLPLSFEYTRGNIKFQDVCFSYEQEKTIQNLSFEIPGGKKIALVGRSGGGKTTLLKLIAGFLHADSGAILIDRQPLPTPDNLDEAVSLSSYYHHVGYLTQEPSVFDGTIYDNLIYALDYVPTDGQIDTAIAQSQCGFIYDLEFGIMTEIGEKGVRLSGGQRQRLAIAKMFLKNPHIILLDEPTSALDSISEELITNVLDELFVGRTVIIIAHRLQTVKKADEILVIDDGDIVERGTHEHLITQNGKYKKMLDLQSGF